MVLMMKPFKKKTVDKPFPEKVARRVSRIPTPELTSWAEQSLNEIGRLVFAYQKTSEFGYLEEALTGAEALHAVVNELYVRSVVK